MAENQEQIKVVIADDHGMVREGLVRMLEDHDDIRVVGIAQDGRAAVDLVLKKTPHVVVMDLGMPGLNGIDATKRITDECADISVLAISTSSDHDLATEVIRAGAKGFVVKDCAFKELVSAVRDLAAGDTYMCKKITRSMVDSMANDKSGKARVSVSISSREREVLQLASEGFSTKEMAGKMKVSAKTVESHRRQLMNKLGLRNLAQLTRYALKQGITSLEY